MNRNFYSYIIADRHKTYEDRKRTPQPLMKNTRVSMTFPAIITLSHPNLPLEQKLFNVQGVSEK